LFRVLFHFTFSEVTVVEDPGQTENADASKLNNSSKTQERDIRCYKAAIVSDLAHSLYQFSNAQLTAIAQNLHEINHQYHTRAQHQTHKDQEYTS
jgi:hypothetical protein